MIDQARLKQLFHYDPETGIFTRLRQTTNSVNIGDVVGSKDAHGYLICTISGRCYKMHRLAWLWMVGEWPKGDVDHKNGVRDDNHWRNLRQASRSQNLANSGKKPTNTSGWKGVARVANAKTWRSSMSIDNRQVHLGTFRCPAAAHFAYLVAAARQHGEFAKGI